AGTGVNQRDVAVGTHDEVRTQNNDLPSLAVAVEGVADETEALAEADHRAGLYAATGLGIRHERTRGSAGWRDRDLVRVHDAGQLKVNVATGRVGIERHLGQYARMQTGSARCAGRVVKLARKPCTQGSARQRDSTYELVLSFNTHAEAEMRTRTNDHV